MDLNLLHGSQLDWILWLAVGAVVGLLKSALVRRTSWTAALLDMSLGIAGAVPAGWFLVPISSTADPKGLHVAGLVGALFGAFVLVALSEVVRP